MGPVPAVSKRAEQIVDLLNEMKYDDEPNRFELIQFKREANEMKSTNLVGAFTILGMIACLEGNESGMRSSHKNAIAYAEGSDLPLSWSMTQYAVSLLHFNLFEEAYEYSGRAYKIDPTDARNLHLLVSITNELDAEQEFQKFAEEYKSITGREHDILMFPEDNEEYAAKSIDCIEKLMADKPNLVVRPDPYLIGLANELIDGVE
ncbi:MAG: hypothetical protein K9K88_06275 [Desulfobacterales bacterium]|nr:hypothetical protein [Desulfobacterales bacterium]